MGNHCIDLAFRHKARTPSPLSLCQNTKNSTSKTANTRIFSNANGGESQGDSAESNAKFSENNTVIARLDEVKSWRALRKQLTHTCKSTVKNNLHEVRTNSRSASWCIKREKKEAEVPPLFLCKKREKARLSPKSEKRSFWRVGERGGGAALFAKKSDYVNETNLAESRRIERVKNAESHTESQKDSADSIESIKMDCHDWKLSQNLTMTAKGDSVESSEKIKMDLQVWASCGRNARHANPCGLSRNDKVMATPHKNTESHNNNTSPTSSLRGDLSPKQSIKNANFMNNAESHKDSSVMDCHDLTSVKSRNDDSSSDFNNPVFARKSLTKQSINANNLAESRRIERVKNAESHTESQKDSADSIESAKDSNIIDCHAKTCGLSYDDERKPIPRNVESHNDFSPHTPRKL